MKSDEIKIEKISFKILLVGNKERFYHLKQFADQLE